MRGRSEASDLLRRALALSVAERAALANTLLDSIEATSESVQEAWDEEVARRIEDLKAGKAVTAPKKAGAMRSGRHCLLTSRKATSRPSAES
jgi:putative addiction module component (TIGR02574 family)